MVLYDPNQDAVVLVEQFRVGAYQSDNPWMLECVAGVVEPGEDDVTVAQRETEEEAGLIIQDPCLIYEYYTTAGICSERKSVCFMPSAIVLRRNQWRVWRKKTKIFEFTWWHYHRRWIG